MEPLIGIRILKSPRRFQPGEALVCDYQLDAIEANEVQALEVSVLWHTEGKGDEDLGVHFFERHVPSDVPGNDLRAQRKLHTTLPCSPLSYDGVMVKIRWCVRVRAFLRWGRECFFEQTFVLGDVPTAHPILAAADEVNAELEGTPEPAQASAPSVPSQESAGADTARPSGETGNE